MGESRIPEVYPTLRRALLALALIAAGCALIAPHFERPELAVVSVELQDARLTQQHFRVRLRVANPNAQVLPVREIHCTVELGGEHFGEGQTTQPFTVPARGAAEFELRLTTDLASTLAKLLPRLNDSAHPLDYRLVGRVDTELAFMRSIPFDQRGTLK
jgi:LEA14-like dessication related protein